MRGCWAEGSLEAEEEVKAETGSHLIECEEFGIECRRERLIHIEKLDIKRRKVDITNKRIHSENHKGTKCISQSCASWPYSPEDTKLHA